MPCPAFTWVPGIWTHFFTLAQQHFTHWVISPAQKWLSSIFADCNYYTLHIAKHLGYFNFLFCIFIWLIKNNLKQWTVLCLHLWKFAFHEICLPWKSRHLDCVIHIHKLMWQAPACTDIRSNQGQENDGRSTVSYDLGFSWVSRHDMEKCRPQLFDIMGSNRVHFLPLIFQSLVKRKLKSWLQTWFHIYTGHSLEQNTHEWTVRESAEIYTLCLTL